MSFPKKNSTSIPRSGTSYNLPVLDLPYQTSNTKRSRVLLKDKSYFSSRSLAQNNNKSYLQQLQKLNLKSQYEDIDFGYLNTQQKKLKSLLKKMNVDTFKMVQSFKSKPKMQTKQAKRTISEMQMINQQQQLTNAKFIQILHYQVKKLQQRSQHLITNNLSKDHYIDKIQSIAKQIFAMKSVNFGEKHQITKISKTLEIQHDHDQQKSNIQKLQNELKFILTKRHKFQSQQKRIIEQQTKLKQNNKTLNDKFQQLKLMPEYSVIIKQSVKNNRLNSFHNMKQQSQSQKQMKIKPQSILQNKKQYIQVIKKKNQGIIQRNQQKYFRILKQLEHIQQNNTAIDAKITQSQGKILQYKDQMKNKEYKLLELKERKRMQVNQLNQFLVNSRLLDIDDPEEKLKQFKNATQHQSQMFDQNEFDQKKSHTEKDVNFSTIKLLQSKERVNPQEGKRLISMTQSKMV